MANFFKSWVQATLPNAFAPSTSTPPTYPSAPTPTPTQPPHSIPSSSRPSSSTAQAFTPIPLQLETKLDTAIRLLERISFQLAELQASQQDGYRELSFRHDTNEINQRAESKWLDHAYKSHIRRVIDEVSKCFAQGGPIVHSLETQHERNQRLYKEVRDAEDLASNASKGERQMRALNIRLLGEINDLRRQLDLQQYTNVPTTRDKYSEGQAEYDLTQRIKKVAERLKAKYERAKEKLERMRQTTIISSDSGDSD